MGQEKPRLPGISDDPLTLQFLRDLTHEVSDLLGVTCTVIDVDGNFLVDPTRPGRFCCEVVHPCHLDKCKACDAKHLKLAADGKLTGPYPCWAGLLTDFVAPLVVDGHLIGGLYGGQMLDHAPDKGEVAVIAKRLGIPERTDELWELVRELPVVTAEEMQRVTRTLRLLAKTLEQRLISDKHARQMKALEAAIEVVAEQHDVGRVLNAVVEQAGKVVSCDVACLWMADEPVQTMKAEVAVGPFANELLATELRIGDGYVGWVAENRKPLLVPNIREEEQLELGYPEIILDKQKLSSLLGVPLLLREELLGVLGVGSRRVDAYSSQDKDMLLAFGRQVVQALVHARLQEEERHRILLDALQRAQASTTDFEQFLRRATQLIAGTFVSSSCTLWVCEQETDELTLRAACGPYQPFADACSFAKGEGIVGHVAAKGESVRAPVACEHPAWSGKHDKKVHGELEGGQRPILTVPIAYKEQAIGVLGVSSLSETDTRLNPLYNLSDERGLRLAADLLGAAFVAEKARRQEQHMKLLGDVTQELARGAELRIRLDRLLRYAAETLGVERASVWLFDEDRKRVVLEVACGPHRAFIGKHCYDLGNGLTGWVAKHGKPVIKRTSKELYSDPRHKGKYLVEVYQGEGSGAPVMFLPLKGETEMLGVIKFSQKRRLPGQAEIPFTEADVNTANIMAAQVASAIRSAKLAEEKDRHLKELAVLSELALAVSSTLRLDQLLPELHKQVGQLMPADTFCVALFDSTSGRLRFEYLCQDGKLRRKREARPDASLLGRVIGKKQALLLAPRRGTIRSRSALSLLGKSKTRPKSLVMAPVCLGKEVLGVLSVQSHTRCAYRQHDAELLRTVGTNAATAIHNARLFAAATKRARTLERIHSVGVRLASVLSLDKRLPVVVKVACGAMESEGGSLYLWDKEYDKLALRAGVGVDPAMVGKAHYGLGEGITGHVAKTGTALRGTAEELRAHPAYKGKYEHRAGRHLASGKLLSGLAFPVRGRNRIVGVLSFDNKKGEDGAVVPFSEEDERVAGILGAHIGVVVENAELFEAQRGSLILAELNDILTSTVDFAQRRDRLFDAIADKALQLPSAERSNVMLVDPETKELYLIARRGPGWTQRKAETRLRVGKDGIEGLVAESGRPRLLTDVRKSSRAYPLFPDVRCQVSVPILSREDVIGVLTIHASQQNAFTPEHVRLLSQLAGIAAVALDNVNLFARATLGSIDDRLHAAKSVRDALGQIVRGIADLVGGDTCSLFLGEGASERFKLAATTGLDPEPADPAAVFYTPGQGLTGWIAEHGKALRLANVGDPEELARHANDLTWANNSTERFSGKAKGDFVRFLGVPLMAPNGKPIGVLRVAGNVQRREFTPYDQQLLKMVADRLVAALEREDLQADQQRRLAEMQTIREADRMIAEQTDLGAMLQQLVDRAMELVGCAGAHIRLLDKEAGKLVLKAQRSNRPTPPHEVASITEQFNRRVLETRTRHVVVDLRQKFDFGYLPDGSDEEPQHYYGDLRSACLVPLKVGDNVLGILYAYKEETNAFPDDDIRLLDDLSSRAVLALVKAQALADARRRLQELEAVHDATLALVSADSLDEQLDTILRAARGIADTDRGSVHMVEPGTNSLKKKVAQGPNPVDEIETAYGIIRDAVDKREAQIVGDVGKDERYAQCWPGSKSELDIPIMYGEKVLGVLNLESTKTGAFGEGTVQRLHPLVATAAVVLHRQEAFLQLAESEKRAALGLIAAGVAHEQNTVLNNIRHCLENLPFETEETERKVLLSNAEREVLRGGGIVRQLLELARSDLAEITACDVNAIVADVVDLVRRQLAVENITVDLRLQDALPLVEANDGSLKQVFLNIITNARQAMKATGGTLTIGIGPGLAGDTVAVAFADTGQGMTEEQKGRAFDPFYTTKPRGQGTGLGLSICKGIVESFGGHMTLDSDGASGTTFTVSLPITLEEEQR